jgi:hypothetical protein
VRLPTRHASVFALVTSAGVVAVAACTGATRTPSAPSASARAPSASARAPSASARAPSASASAPSAPSVSARAGGAVARNVACEGCHAEIAGEWRVSLHRQAHGDPVYQRAFSREPLPFCTGCHAPEADPAEPGPSPAHALGVGCVTCHAIDRSHATAGAAPSETSECAGCHEFAFPGTAEKMQLTATEHRASPRASVACATCHMPRVTTGGRAHASHRFEASHDPELVRRAARITAARSGRKVTFTFTPDQVGHAFPTGDLFRRLRLVVELEGRQVEVFLGRKTKRGASLATAAVNAADDRPFVRGEPAIVDVDLGDDARPRAWRVIYERVEHPTTLDERGALVEGAIEVAAGMLE